MNLISPRRAGLAPGNPAEGGAADSIPPTLDHYLSSPALNNFNLLRLLAATAVAFGHSFALSLDGAGEVEPTTKWLHFTYSGDIAVDVFFLISGIFVSQSLFYERNAASFAIKRFARIWPGLAVCLIISVALVIAVSPGYRVELVEEPATYSYILNNSILKLQWGIPGIFEGRPQEAINGSLWTLPLEAKMYVVVLIFGILGILYSSSMTLIAAIVLALVVLLFPEKLSSVFNAQDRANVIPVLFFFAGMAMFAYRKFIRVSGIQTLAVLALAIILGLPTGEFLFYVFLALATIWFGCSPLIARLPRLRADYSYGIYIYAFPIQQVLATIWPAAGPYAMFALAISITFLFAALSWHAVELPAQDFGKKVAHVVSGKSAPNEQFWSGLRRDWSGIALPVLVVAVGVVGLALAPAPSADDPPLPLDAKIVGFGPKQVVHDQPFNQQPSGESAIWVKLDRPARQDFVLVLGGERLATTVSNNQMTALVPQKLYRSPGSLPLFVERVRRGRLLRTNTVVMQVE